jgi:RNA polymerase sigma factor (sigma-70 family)
MVGVATGHRRHRRHERPRNWLSIGYPSSAKRAPVARPIGCERGFSQCDPAVRMDTERTLLDVAGDAEDRLRRLFTSYAPVVASFLARRIDPGLGLDDLVDETFVIVWRRLDQIPSDLELPWILGVARNVAHNARRARQRRTHYERLFRGPGHHVAATPEDEVITDIAGRAALDQLSSSDRELLRLHAWEGLEPREMAVVLGITANAAATRLSRAKKRFLDALAARPADGTDAPRPHI